MSQLLYNEKYLKTKTKFYNGKINTNFQNNKIAKEGSQYICLSVILTDAVYLKDKSYHPHVLLEEFEYVVNEKATSKFITYNVNVF